MRASGPALTNLEAELLSQSYKLVDQQWFLGVASGQAADGSLAIGHSTTCPGD